MRYATQLHQWLLTLASMRCENLLSEKAYEESVDSVWHIAELIGEKEKDIILTLLNLPLTLDKALDTKSLNLL